MFHTKTSSNSRLTIILAIALITTSMSACTGNQSKKTSPSEPESFPQNLYTEIENGAWKGCMLNDGNYSALSAMFQKLENKEDIVFGAIGGSITMGAGASSPENRWVNLVHKHLCELFPENSIEFHNAGVGSTTSELGAFRAYTDLLRYHPDIVIFEYSINDGINDIATETSEGLLRQILSQPEHPAVIMLAMMNSDGKNCQERHIGLAQHYSLPMISFRNFLEPELKSKEIKASDVLKDKVHPNDTGHRIAASLVNQIIDDAHRNRTTVGSVELPAPLHSDVYQFVNYQKAKQMEVRTSKGWELVKHEISAAQIWEMNGEKLIEEVYNPTKTGQVMELDYEGTFFMVSTYLYPKGKGFHAGKLKISIDGKEYATVDGIGEQTWGGYQISTTVGKDLEHGCHHVRMEAIAGDDPSTDYRTDVIGIGYGTKKGITL